MTLFEPSNEAEKITAFFKKTFVMTKKNKIVINWSGGIDSTVCLYLLSKVLPASNITILHLPYDKSYEDEFLPIASYLQFTKAQLMKYSYTLR